ncbi:MAG: DUF3307 domain-containing protein [Candidatus Zixiibacteriota bacterium]
MDMMWFLMLSHLVGDYALQTDGMALRKGGSRKVLTLHVLLYIVTLALTLAIYAYFTGRFAFLSPRVLAALIAIFALHWIQDDIKARRFSDSRQAYYIDQALHIIQLFLLRGWLS